MKRVLACILSLSLAGPAAAIAQNGYGIRRTPSPAPRSRMPEPTPRGSQGWDRRQDAWDRQLQHCLNDRHQSKRERRICADMGMPVRRN